MMHAHKYLLTITTTAGGTHQQPGFRTEEQARDFIRTLDPAAHSWVLAELSEHGGAGREIDRHPKLPASPLTAP